MTERIMSIEIHDITKDQLVSWRCHHISDVTSATQQDLYTNIIEKFTA